MGEENRSLLEEEIKAEIKRLGSLESGSQEHTTAVDSLTKLYKLKLEEDTQIIDNVDIDSLRQRATPRATTTLSTAKQNKIASMNASGYSTSEIAEALGISTSTVSNYLN